MTGLDEAILYASKTLEVCIIVLIWARGARGQWKWLERLCIFRLGQTALSSVLRAKNMHAAFFYEFWIAEVIAIGIQMGVWSVTYRAVLRTLPWIPTVPKAAFLLTACFVCFAVSSCYPKFSYATLPSIAIACNHMLSVLGCLLLVSSVAYSAAFRFDFTRQCAMIDGGLLLGFLASLLWYSLHLFNPNLQVAYGDKLNNAAYLMTRLIWLLAFVLPATKETIDVHKREQIALAFASYKDKARKGLTEIEVEIHA